ncbi:VCBS repeat-containing protein [Streptomyces canus]|uniref:FG-GAP repeat domain-containing protein n=1 Tax=Streptomyces canus TaxID=58343 RepID=UPI002E2D3A99|nr:VCBS repeat-containing protein [Streptomyces canus]
MTRHAFIRLTRARRAALAVAASAALAAGLSPLLPSASAADEPQETVVPASLRSTYTSASLFNPSTGGGHDGAGAQGVFHALEGHTGRVWTRYSDGKSVPVTTPQGVLGTWGTGSDVLAYRYGDGRVDLWNAVDGTTRTVQLPAGMTLYTAYDDLAVGLRNVTAEDGTTSRETRLLFPQSDGTTRDVLVGGLPDGVRLLTPVGGDDKGLLFRAVQGQQYVWVMVDRVTGQAQSWTQPLSHVYLRAQVSGGHVVLFNPNDATVLVLPRGDLSGTPAELTLSGSGVNPAEDLTIVGDWLVHRPSASTAVMAKPIAGGPSVQLATSNPGISAVPDGTGVFIGRTGADDWGIQRIHADADGKPVVTQVKPLPRPPAPVQGLSLEQGRLVVTDTGGSTRRDDYLRTVAVAGAPTFGERSEFTPRLTSDVVIGACSAGDVACSQVFGTADGRIAWLEHTNSETEDLLRVNGPTAAGYWGKAVPKGGRITDVSGRYVVYTAADKQYVYLIGNDATPAVTRTPGAAALDGDVLWTAATTPGTVTAYSLTARKTTETLTTDAGCSPADLQALGRFLYWSCDGKAGVYDRTANKSVPVPTGEAELGDGFVVTHDKQAGKLTLTTVADGTPASRVIGDLPDTGDTQRNVRWTVDKAGSNAAYVDDQERVHLVPSGVPQQPLRQLAPAQNAATVQARTFDTVPDTLTTVLLSKPSSGWDLTVRNRATGKVYTDGRDGGAARGELNVGWHGLDPARTGDAFVPNGSYDWTLTVTPADGVGAPLQVRGTVRLVKGEPVRHDHVGDDGFGDLLTLNSSGALTFQQSNGKGTFSGKVSASGWPTSVKAVPFGDLSGDRCNDVLVRLSSGALRLYKPGCGAALKPSTPYTSLGTSGWNQYDVLTASGDVTKDGRPDLVARNTSTGAVYLYKGTSAGKLSARVKLYDNWKTYKKVVGAGDLNGDGIGDLLAQDKSNNLYRYYGKGNGTFTARVKLFTNWGGSYNVIVGVGDITGDGKADLVSRDSGGNVWRNNGDGKGSFGARVKIASGWQGYKGLF